MRAAGKTQSFGPPTLPPACQPGQSGMGSWVAGCGPSREGQDNVTGGTQEQGQGQAGWLRSFQNNGRKGGRGEAQSDWARGSAGGWRVLVPGSGSGTSAATQPSSEPGSGWRGCELSQSHQPTPFPLATEGDVRKMRQGGTGAGTGARPGQTHLLLPATRNLKSIRWGKECRPDSRYRRRKEDVSSVLF